MSEDLDEFVDSDFQAGRPGQPTAATLSAAAPDPRRAPTREELEARVNEMQARLAELRRAQQDLERERAALEETRRRQVEFTQGREEMIQQLTRGIAILEQAEFAARRDAEQMTKTLTELRDALAKLQAINQDRWTRDNLAVELTRASTIVENARMEWNAARLKFPILSGQADTAGPSAGPASSALEQMIVERRYMDLCKVGLALSWPLVVVGLAIFLLLAMR